MRSYLESESRRRGVSLREAGKAPPSRLFELALLLVLFVTAGVVPLLRGWWPAIVVAPTLAWVWMVNHWHDAAHFAMSTDWRVNAGE